MHFNVLKTPRKLMTTVWYCTSVYCNSPHSYCCCNGHSLNRFIDQHCRCELLLRRLRGKVSAIHAGTYRQPRSTYQSADMSASQGGKCEDERERWRGRRRPTSKTEKGQSLLSDFAFYEPRRNGAKIQGNSREQHLWLSIKLLRWVNI